MKQVLIIGSLLMLLSACQSQPTSTSITMANMTMHYELTTDSITLTLTAPSSGWIAVGFNKDKSLIGSDLIMCQVQNGQAMCSDQYIRGLGDHPEDHELGGNHNLRILDAWENGVQTQVRFRIPMQSGDLFDFNHQPQSDFQLMLAWSTHDDFTHHSRMRKQRKFRWVSRP